MVVAGASQIVARVMMVVVQVVVDGAGRGQHFVVADYRVRVDLARHDQRVVVAVAARELLDPLRAVHAVVARVIRRVVERGAAETVVVAVAD